MKHPQVLALTALHLGLAALLAIAASEAGSLGSPTLAVVPFAAAIALVGSLHMNVELGRHAVSVTLVEAVVVVMLLFMSPAGVLAAAVFGEVLACVWQRQPLAKVAFNAGSAALAAIAGAVVFQLLWTGGRANGAAWAAALVAASVYATTTHGCTSAVLAVFEKARFTRIFAASLVPVALASLISATIGLAAAVLYEVTPGAVLLVAPLVVLMAAETRRLAAQRAEQLRFERLYAASSRTGGLTSLREVMATLAEESRSLVTGAAAVCCTMEADGTWWGVVRSDNGVSDAPVEAVEASLALLAGATDAEVASDRVPGSVRALSPATESLVLARSDETAAAPVLLAVLRQLSGDDHTQRRSDVLAAFVGHAALTVANARLYADVEDALAHQVDLNRQKDDFVSAVSHELRTPLAAMMGSVLTLRRLDDRLKTDQRIKLLDVSCRQAKRLQRLIEELLTLASVENRDAVPADQAVAVAELVEEITDDLRTQRGADELPPIQFVDTGLGTVWSSEQRLRQVVSNLIENACKYAPGGAIEVRLEPGSDDTVRLSVSDNGPGIAAADRERVFERFVQLDQSSTRAQGGLGLGLYLCREVAAQLGGSLTLSEAPGGGSRFTLTLPATRRPDPSIHADAGGAQDLARASTSGEAA